MELKGLLENLKPVRVGDLPAFLQAIAPLFAVFSKEQPVAEKDIITVMGCNLESFVTAVQIGSRADRAWLEDQSVDVLMELAAKVLEVNADFFGRALGMLGLVAETPPETAKEEKTGGRSSSPDLSKPDSGTKS